MVRREAINLLLYQPYKVGHLVGFTKLKPIHNEWIKSMVLSRTDKTLQGHRGSYKTTCVSLALVVLLILYPSKKILFMRKTDNDIKEIIKQTQKILLDPHISYLCQIIYGVPLRLVTATANEITTNLSTDVKGAAQLIGLGTGGAITGKHFDIIFTDDIVNVSDRVSKAERDRTKLIYQELQNIKNRGGRIFNTGTPWHIEDAFSLMPEPERYDCYSTGLIEPDELERIRENMSPSLFAANYELRHIASDKVIFTSPQTEADASCVEQGECHIDAAYGGSDYTAFTICRKHGDTYYMLGKLWQKHIDDCEGDIITLRKHFNAGRIHCEDNGDKGYVGRDLRGKGERVCIYHENENKQIKIMTYLKANWKNVVFVHGTDQEYINQICDFTEDAEHDDAPDSAASIIRIMANRRESTYQSLWG